MLLQCNDQNKTVLSLRSNDRKAQEKIDKIEQKAEKNNWIDREIQWTKNATFLIDTISLEQTAKKIKSNCVAFVFRFTRHQFQVIFGAFKLNSLNVNYATNRIDKREWNRSFHRIENFALAHKRMIALSTENLFRINVATINVLQFVRPSARIGTVVNATELKWSDNVQSATTELNRAHICDRACAFRLPFFDLPFSRCAQIAHWHYVCGTRNGSSVTDDSRSARIIRTNSVLIFFLRNFHSVKIEILLCGKGLDINGRLSFPIKQSAFDELSDIDYWPLRISQLIRWPKLIRRFFCFVSNVDSLACTKRTTQNEFVSLVIRSWAQQTATTTVT